jgi:hypothetical protein
MHVLVTEAIGYPPLTESITCTHGGPDHWEHLRQTVQTSDYGTETITYSTWRKPQHYDHLMFPPIMKRQSTCYCPLKN